MTISKTVVIALCIINLILGFLTFSQQQQIQSIRQELDAAISDNETQHRRMKSDIDDVESKASDLDSKIDDIESKIDDVENTNFIKSIFNY